MTDFISIRAFENGDRPQWELLWNNYLRFYKAALPQKTTDRTWEYLLDPKEPLIGLGAFEDEQLLGIIHGVIHRSTWLEHYDCYLEDLFVSEAARGKGIGHKLIAELKKCAREQKAQSLYLITHETNLDAQALYNKLGRRTGMIQYRMTMAEQSA